MFCVHMRNLLVTLLYDERQYSMENKLHNHRHSSESSWIRSFPDHVHTMDRVRRSMRVYYQSVYIEILFYGSNGRVPEIEFDHEAAHR